MKPVSAALLIILAGWFPVSGEKTVTLFAVGDIYISASLLKKKRAALQRLNIQGDIVFANFEGVLKKKFSKGDRERLKLAMPMETVALLKQVGFNSLSLANNHSHDYGRDGCRETRSLLEAEGFRTVDDESRGRCFRVGDVSCRLIGFSFSGKNNVNTLSRVRQVISPCREDIIIVSAHMGAETGSLAKTPGRVEYNGWEARGDVRKFSRACIDAGADIVIGHGTHFLRDIELYKDRIILYSLGNFIFDYPGVEKNRPVPSCAVRICLSGEGRFLSGTVRSYIFNRGISKRDYGNRAFFLLRQIARINGHVFFLLPE